MSDVCSSRLAAYTMESQHCAHVKEARCKRTAEEQQMNGVWNCSPGAASGRVLRIC